MDKLFNAPSGPISPRDVRAAVTKEIRLVLYDLEVEAFRSLRRMSADEIVNDDEQRRRTTTTKNNDVDEQPR